MMWRSGMWRGKRESWMVSQCEISTAPRFATKIDRQPESVFERLDRDWTVFPAARNDAGLQTKEAVKAKPAPIREQSGAALLGDCGLHASHFDLRDIATLPRHESH